MNLFAYTPRRELEASFLRTRAGLNTPMTRSKAASRFQLVLARARMGHTRVEGVDEDWAAFQAQGGRALPLRIRVLRRRVYVVADDSSSGMARPGDELLMVDGVSADSWLKRTRRHIPAETDYMADSLLEFMFPRLLWREVGERESFAVVLRRAGRRLRVVIPARTRDQVVEARAADTEALTLTDDRRAETLAGGIGYLRPGPFYEADAKTPAGMFDPSAFRAFVDGAFRQFIAQGTTDVLIDLRDNPGGDNSFSDPMVAWFATKPFRFASSFRVKVSPEAIAANAARLQPDPANANEPTKAYARLYARTKLGEIVNVEQPWVQPRAGERFTGRVYVLQDRHSYSNAALVSAIVQDFGFGTILGESTSDFATTYGAGESFTLPRTGLRVTFPKAYIVRPNGDTRPAGVTPDVAIESPLLQSRSDEVLQRAIAHVRRQQPEM